MRIILLCRSAKVDDPAAARRSARAGDPLYLLREVVIDGQLFARRDRARAHIEDVLPADPGPQVRLAGMVDIFGPAAADGPVNRPIIVKRKEISAGAGAAT